MQALRRIEAWLHAGNRGLLLVCQVATIGLVAAITTVICAGVYYRYVLNDALSWSEEIAKFLMVWMVFTGAPIALRQGAHVAIELLPNVLPTRLRHAVNLAVFLIIMALMAVFVHQGAVFAWNARTQIAATLSFGFPLFWIFLAIPVGGGLMFCIAAELALRAVRGIAGDPELLAEDDHLALAASARD
jgi:TRAP-type C4-dicarboxylate transport system permease small subunit